MTAPIFLFLDSDRGVNTSKGPSVRHASTVAVMLLLLLPLLACVPVLNARVHFALAEDLHAFPKYRVTFLNGLPVLNDTAQRWLSQGLRGGELEFLDQPWNVHMHPPSNLRTIAAQRDDDDEDQHLFENPTVRSHSSPHLLLFLIIFLD